MSRMWGATLDHIVDVEVVTANGTILRANEDLNSDMFYVSTESEGGGWMCSLLTKRATGPSRGWCRFRYHH